MQIDSVSLQSIYAAGPSVAGVIEAKDEETLSQNPETSAPSIPDQEEPVDSENLLVNKTTLDQLLEAGSKTELATDKDDVHALTEEEERFCVIHRAALRIVIYERDRRNAAMRRAVESEQYKAAADEKIDDMLQSVNTLLKGAKLTGEQSEALKMFNLMVNQVKNDFDPFYFNKELNVHGYSTDEMFAGLQSAFDILAKSFDSVMGSTPALKSELEALFTTKFGDVQSGLKDTLGVSDLTEEDIISIVTKYIGTYAETEERAKQDQQIVRDSIPEIIEMIKNHRPDFRIAE